MYIYISLSLSHISHSVFLSCPSLRLGDCKVFAKRTRMTPSSKQHKSSSEVKKGQIFGSESTSLFHSWESALQAYTLAHAQNW